MFGKEDGMYQKYCELRDKNGVTDVHACSASGYRRRVMAYTLEELWEIHAREYRQEPTGDFKTNRNGRHQRI